MQNWAALKRWHARGKGGNKTDWLLRSNLGAWIELYNLWASPWLLHTTTGATGCFTSSHSFSCPLSRLTGTMTRYWLAANLQGISRSWCSLESSAPTSWGIWAWCRRDTVSRAPSSRWTGASFRKQSCSTSRPTETREVNCNAFVFGDRNSHKGWQEHKRGRRDH